VPCSLLADPESFLLANGVELPAGYEVRVTATTDAISFRFLPQKVSEHGALRGGSAGELLFRFEFKLIWD
jgi:hypothetical protein